MVLLSVDYECARELVECVASGKGKSITQRFSRAGIVAVHRVQCPHRVSDPAVATRSLLNVSYSGMRGMEEPVREHGANRRQAFVSCAQRRSRSEACSRARTSQDHSAGRLSAHTAIGGEHIVKWQWKSASRPPCTRSPPAHAGKWCQTIVHSRNSHAVLGERLSHGMCLGLVETPPEEAAAV
jgi:hypothetical protein